MLWKIWNVKVIVFTSTIFTKTVLPNLDALNMGMICTYFPNMHEKLHNTKGVLRNRKWKKDRQYNRQNEKKDKCTSQNHWLWTQVLWKCKHFLTHYYDPLCWVCYMNLSWMMKGRECDYDKRNIYMVIYDTGITQRLI